MLPDNRNQQDDPSQQDQPNADALRLLTAMIRDFQHLIDPDQRTTTKMVYTVMADSGFGIYQVAHHTAEAGHDFLFRLTKSRFKSMRRKAVLIAEGQGYKTYHLLWQPSAKDRKSSPDLPADASLDVVLHEVDIAGENPLYVVTGLELEGPTCATLYRRRYDVEFDIRDFKVTLDAENIRAKSVEMFKKEFEKSERKKQHTEDPSTTNVAKE